jgi:cell division protein FtsB
VRRSFIVVGFVFLVLLIFAAVYLPTLSRYRNLKMQQEQIEREIGELDEKIKALVEERELLQNDVQYIEKIIRDQMGLVKPGEVVYKFIEENLKTPHSVPADEAAPDADTETTPGTLLSGETAP